MLFSAAAPDLTGPRAYAVPLAFIITHELQQRLKFSPLPNKPRAHPKGLSGPSPGSPFHTREVISKVETWKVERRM